MAARLNAEDVESIHSARGTACHELAERCLSANTYALEHHGDVIKTKSHEIEIDDELVASAQEYIDFVRERAARAVEQGGWLKIEQNFSLAKLKPPFDAGGTADAVIYFPGDNLLEVVDLKNGMGVVEVHENKQLRTYGLGAVLNNRGLDVERVRVTVVQPRAPHKDGRIRSEEFHIADLVEWAGDMLDAMRLSAEALQEISVMPFAAWWTANLKSGAHCTFCPAEGQCPRQEQDALDKVGVWFDDQNTPATSNQPDTMDGARLAENLNVLDFIEGWISAVRRVAHDKAQAGVAIPGWHLAEKIGNRKWKDSVSPAELTFATKLSEADIFQPPKIKSPAMLEKVLGAKKKKLIEPFVERPVTGVNLVRADKTSRPAIKPAVETYFQQPEGN